MFVGAADRNNVFALHPEVPGINVGRNINASKMSDMQRSVGIWQGGGYQVSFKLLHDIDNELIRICKTSKDNKKRYNGVKVQWYKGAKVQWQIMGFV